MPERDSLASKNGNNHARQAPASDQAVPANKPVRVPHSRHIGLASIAIAREMESDKFQGSEDGDESM